MTVTTYPNKTGVLGSSGVNSDAAIASAAAAALYGGAVSQSGDITESLQAQIDRLGSAGGKVVVAYSPNGVTCGMVDVRQSNIEIDFNGNVVTPTAAAIIRCIPQSLYASGRITGADFPPGWKNGSTPLPFDGDFETMMHEDDSSKRLSNIAVRGLKTTGTTVPVKAYSVDGLTVEGCDLQPTSNSAVRAFHCSGVRVRRNRLGGTGTYTVFMFKCAGWKVDDNDFLSTSATRHCSAKGVLHESGKTIFQSNTMSTTYVLNAASFRNNRIATGKDGVFWDTVPDYTGDPVGEQGGSNIGFTKGAWMGQGRGLRVAGNQIALPDANTSTEGRACWVSAPHRDVSMVDNDLLNASLVAYGVPGLTIDQNRLVFTAVRGVAISATADSVTSTLQTEFTIRRNAITNYDAPGSGQLSAIIIQGFRGVVEDNVGYGMGSTATELIKLSSSTDDCRVQRNTLYHAAGGSHVTVNAGSQNANGKSFDNDLVDQTNHTFSTDGFKIGTFTPTLQGDSSAGTGTYNANGQVGRYTRIGNRVLFELYLDWSAHTGTGNMRVAGLPFSSNGATNSSTAISIWCEPITFADKQITGYVNSGGSTITISQLRSGNWSEGVPMASSGRLMISGQYEAA